MSNSIPQPDPLEGIQPGPDPSFTPTLPPPPPLPPEPDPDARPRPRYRPFPLHPNFWWGLLWCIALLMFTQVPAGLLAAAVLIALAINDPRSIKGDLTGPAEQFALALGVILAHALIILFALIALRIVAGRDWTRQVAVRWPALSHVLLTIALLPAFMVLGSGFYYLLRVWGMPSFADLGMPGTPNMEEMGKLFSDWPITLAVLTIGVFPGLSEELWCRAFLGRGLVGRHGVLLGVLGTSFLFGLIHIDPCQGTMAIFLGVILHLIYLASRSLLIPILLHFLNNSLAVTITRIPAIAELDSNPSEVPWHLIIAAALLLIVCLFAFWQTRTRLVGLWQPAYPGVACPPPESGTQIVTPPPSALSYVLVGVGLAAFAASLAFAVRAG